MKASICTVCIAALTAATLATTAMASDSRPILSDPYRAGRSMTMSTNGMVASSHYLATQAGVDILRDGGNAVDAAIATAATLAVVEPMMTGIGGDAWMLYYEASTGKVYGLNGSGHSPMGLTRDYFRAKEKEEIDGHSWEAVTVPGAVDAYEKALKRFGSMPFAKVLAPAIRHAEDGFPVPEVIRAVWLATGFSLRDDPAAAATYLVDGRAPRLGEVFRNPRLAESLRIIAAGGADAFYRGPIAEEIVRYSNETGGFLTLDDFARHESTWVDPISTTYRGYDVYQCPPNGQGLGVLLMLNILEGYDFSEYEHNSANYLHLLIEAKKLAYADLYTYVADPEHADIPLDTLLSEDYAAKRRAQIDPGRAAPSVNPGIPLGGDTVYLTAVDRYGNACSFINSLYGPFGAAIVGGDTGILMQNRGEGFTLEEGHFNEYAPGKRPYHTIIPGMVLKDDGLYLSYGLMGGDMQPQGHVQFLLSHLEFGLNIQEAVDVPRWRHMEGLEVRLETGMPDEVKQKLIAKGHDAKTGAYVLFGGAQAILRDPETGTYFGASDPRKDGVALGY